MQGVLERIWENRDRSGQKYWTLSISGQRYSVWDEVLLKDLRPGDLVEFAFTQSGQFRKIVQIQQATGPSASSSTWLQQQDQRGRRIARMSCLRSATEALEGLRLKPESRAKEVLRIARLFEEYVLGEQKENAPPGKVKE